MKSNYGSKWIMILSACMLISSVCFCQKTEQLKRYKETNDVSEKIKACLKLEHTYRFEDRDSSVYFVDKAIELSQQNGLDSLYLTGLNRKSSLLGLMGKTQEGIDLVNSAFEYAKSIGADDFKKTYAYRKGMLFEQMDMPDSAIYYLLINKELSKESKYMSTLTLGEIYSDIGDRELADKYLQEALEIVRIKGRPMDYLFILSSLIDRYESWGNFETVSSLKEEYLTFKINRGDNADKILETNSHAHVNLPSVDIGKQIAKLKSLIPISKNKDDYRTHTQSIYKLIKILNSQGKYQESAKYIEDGLSSANALKNTGIIFNMQQICYVTQKALGNKSAALNHLEKSFSLKDSLRKNEVVKASKVLSTQYETAKKENEIALLKTEDELKTLQLQKASQTRKILGMGLLGALGFLSIVGYLYYQNRKRKEELERKNTIIEKALKEKDILLREIHHRVKNNLQMISSILNLQSNYISDDNALAAINEGKNRVSSMALIHQNLYRDDDVTSIDAKQYFTELISSLYDSYEINKGEVQIELNIEEIQIDVDTMIPLGLIANELVSNALKHAFEVTNLDKKLFVSLGMKEDEIELKVRDNGIGMSLQQFVTSNSFGNKLILAFKQKLKANLQITADQGTEIIFSISNFKLAA